VTASQAAGGLPDVPPQPIADADAPRFAAFQRYSANRTRVAAQAVDDVADLRAEFFGKRQDLAARRPAAARNVRRSVENAFNQFGIGRTLGLDAAAGADANWAPLRRLWSEAAEDAAHRRHRRLRRVADPAVRRGAAALASGRRPAPPAHPLAPRRRSV